MSEHNDELYGIVYDPLKEKKKRKGDQKAKYYKSLSEHERAYKRSHIYGGSHKSISQKLPWFDDETNTIIQKEILTPDLLSRFFFEGITNCTDNIIKSRLENVKCSKVKVTVDKYSMSFENDGLPIPIEPHDELGEEDDFESVVDLIFGKLGSGSNLDDDYERNTAGTNGIGAKLINVFSTIFTVEVGDNIRGVHQKAVWSRNMFTKVKSKCKPSYIKNKKGKWVLDKSVPKYDGPNFVKISFTTDFRKFDQNKYTKDDIGFFKAMAANSSFAVKIPIEFNGVLLDYRDINEYAKLFSKEASREKLVIYSFDEDIKIPEDKKERSKKIKSGELIPIIELCMICTPGIDKDFHISNTNGVYNKTGGIHTDEAYSAVISAIKKLVLSDKSYGITKENSRKLNVTLLKKNVTLILNFKCDDAEFESQMKNELKGCAKNPKIKVSGENMKMIKKWEILNIIYEKFNAKKKEPVNKKRIVDETFRDASLVGKKGVETICLPCEGKSAGQYLDEYIMELEKLGKGGYKIYAKWALRGKLMNISGKSLKDIDKPEKSGKQNELVKFMNIIGLRDGVDYETEEGIATLRYKKVQIMVDADTDGSHILCLLINFFYRRFPSFIKAGRLSWIFTPVMRILKKGTKKTIKRLYSQKEYEVWCEENPKVVHEVEYFKGLAAASPEQAREDARESPNVVLWFDKIADVYLNIAFDQCNGSSEKRKAWILEFKDGVDKEIIRTKKDKDNDETIIYTKISSLINTKLVEYSFETLPRGIPGEDQLKHSLRLAMSWLIEKYKFGKSTAQAEKMEHIANMAAAEFKYHHGATSLISALARLTLDYAGSNNLPFLTHESMTGSREWLGKNCGSGRYVKGRPNWWIKYLVFKELYDIVPKNIVEGKETEPKMIPYLLPLATMNGVKGVSTGWSTFMTNYHPGDICKFVYRLICNKKVFPLVPWFINFKGDVTLEIKKSKTDEKTKDDETDKESEDDDEEDEIIQSKKLYGLIMKTEGIFKIKKQEQKTIIIEEEDPDNYGETRKITKDVTVTDFVITEVPIGIEPAKLVLKLKDQSDDVFSEPKDSYSPYIKVKGYIGSMEPDHIGMIVRRSLSNLTFVTKEGIPVTYDNVYQSIEAYCDNLKELYAKRREILIREIQEELDKITKKAFLIKKVVDKEWKFIKVKRDKIKKDLVSFEISYDIFKGINSDDYTEEGYEEALKKLGEMEAKLINVRDGDYLKEWKEALIKFAEEIDKRPEYTKLKKHIHKEVKCSIGDLTSGKIVAPYEPEIYVRTKNEKLDKDDETEN